MTSCHTFYTFTTYVSFLSRGGLSESAASTAEWNKKCWTWNCLCARALAKWRRIVSNGSNNKKNIINKLQFYYITRWYRCSMLTPRVIVNKMHIGPQFEYIISKRFSVSKTLFHSSLHMLKIIKSHQVQQATTSYPSDCCWTHARERRGSAHRASLSERELFRTWHLRDCTQYPQPHQMSGLVERQAYIQII